MHIDMHLFFNVRMDIAEHVHVLMKLDRAIDSAYYTGTTNYIA